MCEIIKSGASNEKCLRRCDRIADMCDTCRIEEASLWTKPY